MKRGTKRKGETKERKRIKMQGSSEITCRKDTHDKVMPILMSFDRTPFAAIQSSVKGGRTVITSINLRYTFMNYRRKPTRDLVLKMAKIQPKRSSYNFHY